VTTDIWKLVEQIADEVASQPEHRDEYTLERISDELFDSVKARRRDQKRFRRELRGLAQRMAREEWSVKAPPSLRLVTEDEFEQMAYPNGRETA